MGACSECHLTRLELGELKGIVHDLRQTLVQRFDDQDAQIHIIIESLTTIENIIPTESNRRTDSLCTSAAEDDSTYNSSVQGRRKQSALCFTVREHLDLDSMLCIKVEPGDKSSCWENGLADSTATQSADCFDEVSSISQWGALGNNFDADYDASKYTLSADGYSKAAKPQYVRCDVCDAFIFSSNMQRHVQTHHKKAEVHDRERVTYSRCSHCNRMMLSRNLAKHFCMQRNAAIAAGTANSASDVANDGQPVDQASVTNPHKKLARYVPCPHCELVMLSNNLKRHIRTHQRSAKSALQTSRTYRAKPSVCPVCSRVVNDPSNFRRHMRAQHPNVSYNSGTDCAELDSSMDSCDSYIPPTDASLDAVSSPAAPWEVGGVQYRRCTLCNLQLRNIKALEQHMLLRHGPNAVPMDKGCVCPVCELECSTVKSMKAHLLRKHASYSGADLLHVEDSAASTSTSAETEDIKPKESVLPSHRGYKRCPQCRRMFISESLLRRHISRQHGAGGSQKLEDGACVCTLCNLECSTIHSLTRHMQNKHPGVECGQTDRGVKRDEELSDAVVVAPESLVDSAADPITSSIVPKVGLRKLHYKRCPYCRVEMLSSNLRRHIRAHHGPSKARRRVATFGVKQKDVPQRCPVCTVMISNASNLKRHIRAKHVAYDPELPDVTPLPVGQDPQLDADEVDDEGNLSGDQEVRMKDEADAEFGDNGDESSPEEAGVVLQLDSDSNEAEVQLHADLNHAGENESQGSSEDTNNVNERKLQCHVCFKDFHNQSNVKRHLFTVHKIAS